LYMLPIYYLKIYRKTFLKIKYIHDIKKEI
jgi:hypothetical protein